MADDAIAELVGAMQYFVLGDGVASETELGDGGYQIDVCNSFFILDLVTCRASHGHALCTYFPLLMPAWHSEHVAASVLAVRVTGCAPPLDQTSTCARASKGQHIKATTVR